MQHGASNEIIAGDRSEGPAVSSPVRQGGEPVNLYRLRPEGPAQFTVAPSPLGN